MASADVPQGASRPHDGAYDAGDSWRATIVGILMLVVAGVFLLLGVLAMFLLLAGYGRAALGGVLVLLLVGLAMALPGLSHGARRR